MGLEEMLNAIRANTESQYSKIITDAKTEADRILAQAEQSSQSIVSQGKVQGEKELQEEKLRTIASARLEGKRKYLETREQVLKRYEEGATRYLKEFARSPNYRKFLQSMIQEGVSKIGPGAIVQVNASDKKLLATGDMIKNGEYKLSPNSMDCIGGAMISSPDGKRRIDNTIESIFAEKKEDLRLKITEQLFGKKE